ncbi:hypothetical protein [Halorhodospira halophila]|uniref:Uncharacterized protein n=1 Tax=Halorhodospira halophila (strain DSM 244 / SL1) TaxID=349124 RepID=A1WTT2_HALHL|nr:hypothetical protein [Halorhodospira halophila]ABM61094.1 hypothetical protein Hhal_0300 [Halorhodospira halophila SL1]MBK1729811.1 hypothetical protein [Halorhodospira halophila]
MDFDTLGGKLALVGLTGVAFAILYMLFIAIAVDPRLISMDWLVVAALAGAGCSYLIYEYKGIIK